MSPELPDQPGAVTADQPVGPARRGRPPGTSARALEVVALRLFAEHGFDDTTVDDIAAGAGVSRRTFFRYFDSKAEVLWGAFDAEVDSIRALFDAVDADLPVMAAVRQVVLAVNYYSVDDVPELRARMGLISSVPALAASATSHYDAWEREVAAFVGRRTGVLPTALLPRTVGRTTLAACRAAYEQWADDANRDLRDYLAIALGALAAGFTEASLSGASG